MARGGPGVHLSDETRRHRLVERHHLNRSAPGVVAAVQDLLAFHSTDPVTPYLSARARVAGFRRADLDQALQDDRTLLRLHAMRRTLFIVATDEAHVILESEGRVIARKERRRIERWVRAAMESDALNPGSEASPCGRTETDAADGPKPTLRTG